MIKIINKIISVIKGPVIKLGINKLIIKKLILCD